MSFRIVVLFFVCLSSCQKTARKVSPAFYHWQTHFSLSQQENLYLSQIGAEKIYVKFFDVDWDFGRRAAVPLATVQFDTLTLPTQRIIPTVFITNRTFLNLPEDRVEILADNVHQKLNYLIADKTVEEVQMDCDWTAKTRGKYFHFLELLQQKVKQENRFLSITIRLHQFKYPQQTGIPPVSKGMLMVYNVGKLEDWFEQNSILTEKGLTPYLGDFSKYPLELDIALPIFSWGVVYRDRKLIKLINNLRTADLQDTSIFKQLTENRFEIKKSNYLNGYYMYAGDRIRLEAISPSLLNVTADVLAKNDPANELTVAFYHLDSSTIKHYHHEQIQEIIAQFEH